MSEAHPDLLVLRPEGLYCPAGDFHIDPWQPVDRALITHAHADHARPGHRHYLASQESLPLLRSRLGAVDIQALRWGESVSIQGVRVSLHPAGHILGSAQIRLEHRARVWVVSGDYKLEPDPTCSAFEPVRCDTFITESTFGLPVYRWPSPQTVMHEILHWWSENASQGRASVLHCYSLGKAQRILAGLAAQAGDSLGPIAIHGTIRELNQAYAQAAIALPDCLDIAQVQDPTRSGALVLAPPGAEGSAALRRFGAFADAFASGWMQLRGIRRRRGVDRGFVLSDHADWTGLRTAIAATGAQRVLVTHGQVAPLVRWLQEQGLQAQALSTRFGDEGDGDA